MDIKKLPDLDVKDIKGINETYGEKLKSQGITTIKELAACDALETAKKTKIPLYKIIELRKKALLVRGLIFFNSFVEKLGTKNFTIQQTFETEIKKIKKITGESEQHCLQFLQQLSIITLFLDTNIINSVPISILQTEPYVGELPLPIEKQVEL
ncbi:MAG: hypothetical protein ACTSQQ_15440, partial [Candidatus Helarchaeota archaeon]